VPAAEPALEPPAILSEGRADDEARGGQEQPYAAPEQGLAQGPAASARLQKVSAAPSAGREAAAPSAAAATTGHDAAAAVAAAATATVVDAAARVWERNDGSSVQRQQTRPPGPTTLRQDGRASTGSAGQRWRGWPAQRLSRQREQQARQAGVLFRQHVAQQGCTRQEAARLLGVKTRTLRLWEQLDRQEGLPARPLGRPTTESSVARRNEVIGVLKEHGPGRALATLRQQFSDMSRAELADLLGRYRRVWRKKHGRLLRVLHWLRPGSVWGMDFVQAAVPIDGCYKYVLAVRDLASHYVLLWLPVPEQTAATALAALQALFAEHGCALVLKSDNGSGFHALVVTDLLSQERIQALYSPAYCPAYNGSVEAGNGALKTRTHHQAARAGHAGMWTCADVEAARQEANRQARPWGENGPSPQQVWERRQRITTEERERFAAALQEQYEQVRREQQEAKERDRSSSTDQAKARRQAISRTLVALGYLSSSRRRIPPPI
jgi:DNA-binding transcriptional MerR regulator